MITVSSGLAPVYINHLYHNSIHNLIRQVFQKSVFLIFEYWITSLNVPDLTDPLDL